MEKIRDSKICSCFFVCLIDCENAHSVDYGEWKVLMNWKVRYAESLRFSSQAYRIKCGIVNGAKPNGNIVVAEIAKRTVPFNKKRIVMRSFMYPFGQINRTYDTIDLADVLLGLDVSRELKNKVFVLNKLCALDLLLKKYKTGNETFKKNDIVSSLMSLKENLGLYNNILETYVSQGLINGIKDFSTSNLKIPSLKKEIKELKNSIMPLFKNYIEKLKDFLSERNIANLTIRDGGFAAIDVARAHIANIFSRWDNGETPKYDIVISDLKIVSSIKENVCRLVHAENILLYYMRNFYFEDYRPLLICTYLNMCSDCERIVSEFANIYNGGDGIIVVSEKENPGEENIRRNFKESLVKKIKIYLPRLIASS